MNAPSLPVILLHLLVLGFIGLLPRIFFRRDGRYHLRWFLTAAPFFANAAFLLLLAGGVWQPLGVGLPHARVILEAASVPFAALSIALMALTIGTHRVPLALWHQDNDAPASIVTWGPYRSIRHPFYLAFLVALAGAFVAAPHPSTLLSLAGGLVGLNVAAAREETRLAASALGAEYRAYLARTGRFLPKRHAGREYAA